MSLLKVENLTVRYGAIEALREISFEVNEGEIVTFVGSNGAGKTTTMRSLSSLVKMASGRIQFKGKDIHTLPSHLIVRMGLVQSPEGRLVFPDLSVRENLMLGAFSRKASATEINQELDSIFELFPRLKERLKQDAHTLSGGEQQMLAIGRALMAKPALLLLDEPSLGIAPLLVQQIFQKILELNRKEGMTILLAEQNARMALKIAHRAYVLEVGEIVQQGQASELLKDEALQKAYLGG
ncbi:MAG: ABC transporter ATP-binding protein [Betaproteobacteria bacterium]|nr:ABC transporter ATP-binding protein [Betaproteobacteria bacterium]